MKHVGMSQSAAPAARNEAARRLEPPKVTTSSDLAIGTTILPSRQSLANGCGHKSSVERARLNPQASKVKPETFATRSGIIYSIVYCICMQHSFERGFVQHPLDMSEIFD